MLQRNLCFKKKKLLECISKHKVLKYKQLLKENTLQEYFHAQKQSLDNNNKLNRNFQICYQKKISKSKD